MAKQKADTNAKDTQKEPEAITDEPKVEAGDTPVATPKVPRTNVAVGEPGEITDFGNEITITTN